jgi:hypothetical protein
MNGILTKITSSSPVAEDFQKDLEKPKSPNTPTRPNTTPKNRNFLGVTLASVS